MNLIYSTDTKEFSPISHGDTYLYEKYFRIFSFLKTKLKDYEYNRLAQPIVKENMVDWHGNYANKMRSLSNFDPSIQKNIESSYVELLSKTKKIVKELLSSGDDEKMAWGKLISETFDAENNILITDGNEWAIIWGWQFRNKLNFANADFISDKYVEPTTSTSIKTEPESSDKLNIPPPSFIPVEDEQKSAETIFTNSDEEIAASIEEEKVLPPPTITPPIIIIGLFGFFSLVDWDYSSFVYRNHWNRKIAIRVSSISRLLTFIKTWTLVAPARRILFRHLRHLRQKKTQPLLNLLIILIEMQNNAIPW
ncbi:MAG: hypothetical protein EBR41_04240 [Crocinitomicaceae bacterium]|nr:hypothetical protein [Crocinitomicaceae bacterium]